MLRPSILESIVETRTEAQDELSTSLRVPLSHGRHQVLLAFGLLYFLLPGADVRFCLWQMLHAITFVRVHVPWHDAPWIEGSDLIECSYPLVLKSSRIGLAEKLRIAQ